VLELSPQSAIPLLRAGGIIACPTEAVWGLSCDPANQPAVMRLVALKQRSIEKGLILVAADSGQLDGWARLDILPPARRQVVLDTWPGPHTWVLPVGERTPSWVSGVHPGIAVRLSAHPLIQVLCREFAGPLVSTSANLSGQPPPRRREEIDPRLLDRIDALVKGDTGQLLQPTPIRDAASGRELR